MLAIRMQRTGRKGRAQFRVVVQDSRQTPSSARVIAALGSYDPHTKAAVLDSEKVTYYLSNGARPSDRVAKLLTDQGFALPDWVQARSPKSVAIKNSDKLRKNRPVEESAEPETVVAVEAEADTTPVEESAVEA